MKYRQLRDILNGLSEAQLDQDAMVHNIEDSETPVTRIVDSEITEEDFYVNKDDNEDVGTLKLLEECYDSTGEDDVFNPENYKIATPKGTFLLFNE
jgi:hypothetical protein